MRKDRETKKQQEIHQEPESPSYRLALKNLFTCTTYHSSTENHRKKCKKMGCSGSLCNQKESSRIMQRPEELEPCERRRASISVCTGNERITKKPLIEIINGELDSHKKSNSKNNNSNSNNLSSSSSSSSCYSYSYSSSYSVGGSFRGMHQFRRLSGCYECNSVVDPVHGFSLRASSMCSCPDCGEIFVRTENLEHHQAIRHAVSELGPEDTSRNIIEIIFQSSWLKKQSPTCTVDRILKVHNTQKTISKFEDYRDSIKIKAGKLAKKYPRCTADGNELLRFHCATLTCQLGLNGSTNLCGSNPSCQVCSVIKDGFKPDPNGRIPTMATSGRAHDAVTNSDEKRAMLVCRVIAGRVKRMSSNGNQVQTQDGSEEFDSQAGATGLYSNLDELFVFSPKAILPCFVVIYKA